MNALGVKDPSANSKAIVLPKAEEIAPVIVVEDVTGDSLSLSFDANSGISEYFINVDKYDDASGDFVFDQRVR